MIDSKYQEHVEFKHDYLDVVFGVYPVPEFYRVGDYPDHEVHCMTVYLDDKDNLHLEEICQDGIISLENMGFFNYDELRGELKDLIWYGEVKLYPDDMDKLLDACIRVIRKRTGKEESNGT